MKTPNMQLKQLNGYTIKFYNETEWYFCDGDCDCSISERCEEFPDENQIWFGEVINIPEELAEKIVNNVADDSTFKSLLITGEYTLKQKKDATYYQYQNYSKYTPGYVYDCNTAKESFQTLSDLPYCVITKE